MAERAARNRAWKQFWQSGHVASCVPGQKSTEQEIHARWQSFFAGLPEGSRILDIATGNGALLRQAALTEQGSSFELTGVDLAAIDPLKDAPGELASHPALRFIGEIDAASLPFDDASFDVVVSQFGLEYADLDAALKEVERVLSPSGRLRWLAHSEESEVVVQNRDRHRQVDLLLAKGGPLDSMGQLVARLKRGKNPGLTMNRLDKSMRAAEEYLHNHPPADIVREVCRGLADTANRWQAYDPNDLETMVEHSRRQLKAHRQRILDLGEAVLTPARLQGVEAALAAPAWSEFGVDAMRVGDEERPIGCLVDARRSDA